MRAPCERAGRERLCEAKSTFVAVPLNVGRNERALLTGSHLEDAAYANERRHSNSDRYDGVVGGLPYPGTSIADLVAAAAIGRRAGPSDSDFRRAP